MQGQSQPSYSTPADVSERRRILSLLLSFRRSGTMETSRKQTRWHWGMKDLFQQSMVKVALEAKLRLR